MSYFKELNLFLESNPTIRMTLLYAVDDNCDKGIRSVLGNKKTSAHYVLKVKDIISESKKDLGTLSDDEVEGMSEILLDAFTNYKRNLCGTQSYSMTDKLSAIIDAIDKSADKWVDELVDSVSGTVGLTSLGFPINEISRLTYWLIMSIVVSRMRCCSPALRMSSSYRKRYKGKRDILKEFQDLDDNCEYKDLTSGKQSFIKGMVEFIRHLNDEELENLEICKSVELPADKYQKITDELSEVLVKCYIGKPCADEIIHSHIVMLTEGGSLDITQDKLIIPVLCSMAIIQIAYLIDQIPMCAPDIVLDCMKKPELAYALSPSSNRETDISSQRILESLILVLDKYNARALRHLDERRKHIDEQVKHIKECIEKLQENVNEVEPGSAINQHNTK